MDWTLILNVTFVGIIIVFFSLVLLSICVYAYPKLLYLKKKKDNDLYDPKPIEPKRFESAVVEVEQKSYDEDEIAVVIAAAIEAYGGTSYASNITVRSIKRINSKTPVWNATGRLEALN